MDINRDNYEAYFLDYAEGNLSAEDKEVLHHFLRFNPDLSAELETFGIYPLQADTQEYPNKELLKKKFPEENDSASFQNFDLFCIAYLEGDLTEDQRISYEEFLSTNLQFLKKHEAFKSTFLNEEHISFPSKGKLKKKKPIIISWKVFMPIAAAAAILLMFLIGPAEQGEAGELALALEEKSVEEVQNVNTEDKKPLAKAPQSTLKVIKGSRAPVPITDYSKKEQSGEAKTDKTASDQASEKETRIASLDLRKSSVSEIKLIYDRIESVPIQPPSVNSSSLSALDMAKYQLRRATDAMEDEDVFLWNLASNGLNRISGNNVQLLASKDEEGSISGIQLKSRFLNITTPISREE